MAGLGDEKETANQKLPYSKRKTDPTSLIRSSNHSSSRNDYEDDAFNFAKDGRPVNLPSSPPPLDEQNYDDGDYPLMDFTEEKDDDKQHIKESGKQKNDDNFGPIKEDNLNGDENNSSHKKHSGDDEEEEDDNDGLPMRKVHSSKSSTKPVNITSIKSLPKLPTEPSLPPKNKLEKIGNSSAAEPALSSSSRFPTTSSEMSPSQSIEKSDVVDENGKFIFFWTDHEEIGSVLLLFGKIKLKNQNKYVSCTIKVNGLCRDIYVLPRQDLEDTEESPAMQRVHAELTQTFGKLGVKEFRAKPAVRKYCFELRDIPREAEYMKVLLPYDGPQLPDHLSSGKTYSHVFGAHTNMFEQFVLSRNIMGPSWLEISNSKFDQGTETWCLASVGVDSPLDISPVADSQAPSPPPLKVMSISIKTDMNHKENKQEIVAISSRVYQDIAHDTTSSPESLPSTILTAVRPKDKLFPSGFEEEFSNRSKTKKEYENKINTIHKTEQSLLNYYCAQIHRYDPDVIVGHQLENIQLSVLLHRMKDLKVRFWHRLGRVKRNHWPSRIDIFQCRRLMAGRLICDISNDMGKSITTKCDSWSLTEMCSLYLKVFRQEIEIDISKFPGVDRTGGLLHVLDANESDTFHIFSIALKVQILALSKQLTNLAGNSWARTLTGSRVDRNEFILLHEFTRQKYIVPEKESKFNKQNRSAGSGSGSAADGTVGPSKAKFQGGLVFEPEKGLYKSIVLVMDFNSLYPSIIQEFNICFTTVDRSQCSPNDEQPPPLPDSSLRQGIFPRLIENLVQRRREVKRIMKDPKATDVQRAQWDIKQQALKLTANSMYGCLGFEHSRFYALPLAMLTTYKGREILSSTRELAEDNGLKVVYGDTDSVMINTNVLEYDQAMQVGNMFKKKVNERYKKLEIDTDNVFQRLLLLAKKKYAAVNMTASADGQIFTSTEVKGLDLKRREYSQLSKDASKYVLSQILEEENEDLLISNIHEYLRDLSEKVRNNQINLPLYIIKNKLGKNPQDYPDGQRYPQVQVALRRIANGEIVKADDVISYIIVAGDEPVPERARTLAEVSKENLQVDGDYYLVSQVLPPIERLCAQIEGTDRVHIAECLGIDLQRHNILDATPSGGPGVEMDLQPLETTITDGERFKDAHRFMVTCKCHHQFIYKGLEVGTELGIISSTGVNCPGCQQMISQTMINAQLECAIRREIANYYAGWLICDDTSCATRTRQISVYGKKCPGQDGTCRGLMSYEYTDKMLYNQLLYFDSLFDMDKAKKNASMATEFSDGDKKEQEDEKKSLLTKQQVGALAEQNRKRFEITRTVVNKYLSNCGRRYVDMYGIFNFL